MLAFCFVCRYFPAFFCLPFLLGFFVVLVMSDFPRLFCLSMYSFFYFFYSLSFFFSLFFLITAWAWIASEVGPSTHCKIYRILWFRWGSVLCYGVSFFNAIYLLAKHNVLAGLQLCSRTFTHHAPMPRTCLYTWLLIYRLQWSCNLLWGKLLYCHIITHACAVAARSRTFTHIMHAPI